MKEVRRGWKDGDERLFADDQIEKMSLCAYEAAFLLERGYPLKSAITVTGNRRLLSERQRIAMGRMTACPYRLARRRATRLDHLERGCTVHIDAFNAVVIMETALSHSVVLKGMDGCIRDLSGLAGTYSIISVTDEALSLIFRKLIEHGVGQAVFYIDSPVSNSGRLKSHIAEKAEELNFPIDLVMTHNADTALKAHDHVISADSEVIEECLSWYNLYPELLEEVENPWVIELHPH